MVKAADIEVRSLIYFFFLLWKENVSATKTNVCLEVPLVSPFNVVLTHLTNHILHVTFLVLHIQ